MVHQGGRAVCYVGGFVGKICREGCEDEGEGESEKVKWCHGAGWSGGW